MALYRPSSLRAAARLLSSPGTLRVARTLRRERGPLLRNCVHLSRPASAKLDSIAISYACDASDHIHAVVVALGAAAACLFATAHERLSTSSSTAACAVAASTDEDGPVPVPPPGPRSDLPTYRLADVRAHGTSPPNADGRVWVCHGAGVYDVTDFLRVHPGGNKLLLAAGGSVAPYWSVYQQHNTAEVANVLARLRIGNLAPEDMAAMHAAPSNAGVPTAGDAYARDPVRNPLLVVRASRPFNGETPGTLLTDAYVTPTELMFVRNHLPVPTVDPTSYRLKVCGEGLPAEGVSFSLDDLRTRFDQHTVVSALQCSGNRRADMASAKAARGLSWNVGAMANVEWTGVWLRDVLQAAGLRPEAVGSSIRHVQFEGLDQDPTSGVAYAASIPADRAFDPRADVLLALSMNGKALTRDHGFPVRVVVPGVTGARQVKWLGRIIASSEESDSLWQQKDYKAFPQTMDGDTVDFNSMPAMQELPVTSAICEPADGSVVALSDNEITLKGFAYSGGGRAVVRVDVSLDGGKNWVVADIVAAPEDATPSRHKSWGWTLWRADIPIPPELRGKELNIVCKAMDTACNTQPESPVAIWNFRGLANNSWHRVRVRVV